MDLTTKSYVDTAVAGAGGGGGEDHVTINSTGGNPTAAGSNAIGIGYYAQAAGGNSITIGYNAYATTNSIAIGLGANGSGGNAVAIGPSQSHNQYRTEAFTNSVSIGFRADSHSNCVSIGAYANAAGASSTAYGYNARAFNTNSTALGNGAYSASNNKFVLGNTSVNDLRCQDTSITATSDSRDKTDIADLTLGLDFISSITPKAYRRNNRNDYYVAAYTPEQLAADDTLVQSYTFDQTNYDAGTQKTTWTEFGFLAQDVVAQLPDMYADARVAFEETDHDHGYSQYKFTEGDLIPVLWKAIQELKAKTMLWQPV